MKRLKTKLANRILVAFKTARILRLAEWLDVSISDPNIVQYITDSMATGAPIQINYEGSGWRDIYPYGWKTSKFGNVLLMCYKDTGEVRSYRLDRVMDVHVDSNTQAGETLEQNIQQNTDVPQEELPGTQDLAPREEVAPFQQQVTELINDDNTQLDDQENSDEAQQTENTAQPELAEEQKAV